MKQYVTIYAGESADRAVPIVSSSDPAVVGAALDAMRRRLDSPPVDPLDERDQPATARVTTPTGR